MSIQYYVGIMYNVYKPVFSVIRRTWLHQKPSLLMYTLCDKLRGGCRISKF